MSNKVRFYRLIGLLLLVLFVVKVILPWFLTIIEGLMPIIIILVVTIYVGALIYAAIFSGKSYLDRLIYPIKKLLFPHKKSSKPTPRRTSQRYHSRFDDFYEEEDVFDRYDKYDDYDDKYSDYFNDIDD